MKIPLILTRLKIIVEKNLKRLISSKISASIILFGPLIMILLLGTAFQSTGFFGVKVGIYSENYNQISDEIVEAMQKTDFEVIREVSIDNCVENVREGDTHLCIQFPTDFKTEKISFYVDYSRLNLVYAIVSKISEEITSLSNQISLGTAEDIISFIGDSSKMLESSESTLVSMKNKANDLKNQLNSISESLETINLDAESGSLDELTSETGELTISTDTMISYIDEIESDIDALKSDLNSANEEATKQLTNINTATAALSCTSGNTRDLSIYLSGDNFTEELEKETKPECSLLLTFKTNLQNYKNSIDEYDLDEIEDLLDSLRSEILSMQQNIKIDASSAKQSLNNLSSAKQSLSNQLKVLSVSTGYSVEIFDIMNEKLNTLTDSFKEISATDASSVIKPIKTSIKPLTAKKVNNLDLIFPAILVMMIMFVGILMGNILIMREKTSKAYFRNLIMPVKNYVFIIGTYLTTIIVTFIQLIVMISIILLFFNTNLSFSIQGLLPVVLLSTIAFASIGMIIGYLANSEETSTMAAISISIILLLFSNVIIPIETMEQVIGIIARFTPFNVTELILRRSLILDSLTTTNDAMLIFIFLLQIIFLIAGVAAAHRREYNKKK